MSDAPGLTKYWTVPGASLLLEEPQPKTFIPRWGLSFASEAVYLASEVEARERAGLQAYRVLFDELTNIANANTRDWDDPTDFKAWAQNRARAALAQAKGKP